MMLGAASLLVQATISRSFDSLEVSFGKTKVTLFSFLLHNTWTNITQRNVALRFPVVGKA
jgi:hypothetical protein